MAGFLTFLLTPLGRLIAGLSGALLIIVAFASHERSIGARSERLKIEKATNHAIDKASSAARKSRSGGGVLNPHYRD